MLTRSPFVKKAHFKNVTSKDFQDLTFPQNNSLTKWKIRYETIQDYYKEILNSKWFSFCGEISIKKKVTALVRFVGQSRDFKKVEARETIENLDDDLNYCLFKLHRRALPQRPSHRQCSMRCHLKISKLGRLFSVIFAIFILVLKSTLFVRFKCVTFFRPAVSARKYGGFLSIGLTLFYNTVWFITLTLNYKILHSLFHNLYTNDLFQ